MNKLSSPGRARAVVDHHTATQEHVLMRSNLSLPRHARACRGHPRLPQPAGRNRTTLVPDAARPGAMLTRSGDFGEAKPIFSRQINNHRSCRITPRDAGAA